MAAIFPSNVATALQLLTAVNNTKVTLNADAGIGDTSLTVDDASPLPNAGYVTFDDNEGNPETVFYSGKSGNNLTGVTRAADGTSAGTHVTGAHLEIRFNAAYHNTLATELIAVEQYLSDRFGIASSPVVPSSKTLTLAATTNQLVLGTTNTVTVNSTAPAASRVYTLPDAGGNATFVLSTGNATLSLATSLTVTGTSNQIVLGTTRTVTITAPTPASSSRTWTIPDIAGDGTFAALQGTQTFSGAKTFATDVTITAAGNGVIVTTPDGAHTVRISASNLDASGISTVTAEVIS